MSAKYQAGVEAMARNKEEDLRLGKIEVVRARSRSVFNYWKDCVGSDFRSAVGIRGRGADLQDASI